MCRGAAGRHTARIDGVQQGEGAHRGAHRAGCRQFHSDRRLHDAGRYDVACDNIGRCHRLLPDRLDRAQRHLSLSTDGGERCVPNAADRDRRRHRRSSPSVAANCVLVRRVLRGGVGLRHPGRRHRSNLDRPGVFPTCGVRSLAYRQHRARCVWRTRYTDRRSCECHRPRSFSLGRDGWSAVAVLLTDRSILVDLGVRGIPRHEGCVAGNLGDRRFFCHSAIPDLELHQSMDCRYRRFAHLLPKIWRPKVVWTSPALRTRDDSAATMPKKPVKVAREPTTAEVWFSLLPWIIVCVILLLWGTNAVKGILNAYATWNFPVPGL